MWERMAGRMVWAAQLAFVRAPLVCSPAYVPPQVQHFEGSTARGKESGVLAAVVWKARRMAFAAKPLCWSPLPQLMASCRALCCGTVRVRALACVESRSLGGPQYMH